MLPSGIYTKINTVCGEVFVGWDTQNGEGYMMKPLTGVLQGPEDLVEDDASLDWWATQDKTKMCTE